MNIQIVPTFENPKHRGGLSFSKTIVHVCLTLNSYLWTYVYTVPYIMLLMQANPFRGQVEEGLGPGNQDFLGPK
jgi:hypothetical protein